MGLPIIPFVVGAAVGAASAYLAKDKAMRDRWLSRFKEMMPGDASDQELGEEDIGKASEESEETVEDITSKIDSDNSSA